MHPRHFPAKPSPRWNLDNSPGPVSRSRCFAWGRGRLAAGRSSSRLGGRATWRGPRGWSMCASRRGSPCSSWGRRLPDPCLRRADAGGGDAARARSPGPGGQGSPRATLCYLPSLTPLPSQIQSSASASPVASSARGWRRRRRGIGRRTSFPKARACGPGRRFAGASGGGARRRA